MKDNFFSSTETFFLTLPLMNIREKKITKHLLWDNFSSEFFLIQRKKDFVKNACLDFNYYETCRCYYFIGRAHILFSEAVKIMSY